MTIIKTVSCFDIKFINGVKKFYESGPRVIFSNLDIGQLLLVVRGRGEVAESALVARVLRARPGVSVIKLLSSSLTCQ